jgi:hypothetical protein
MNAGIASTINRHVAELITRQLDINDQGLAGLGTLTGPWHLSPIADTLMGDNDSSDGDRAFLIGLFAARTPGVNWDGHPADCDWEDLFSHFRAEVLARRNPKTPPADEAETPLCGVV